MVALKRSFNADDEATYELTMAEEHADDRFQEWVFDDGGRIASMALSEMMLTTAAKSAEGCELRLEKKEEKDPKKRQDQSFNICVLLKDDEQVPLVEIS